MRRTCATSIVMLLTAALLAVVSPGPAAAADHDCSDFASQRQAQIYYLNHGGPQSDPDDLDRDGDGTACDSNPCPCYYGTQVPGSAPAATHRRTVNTRVSLRAAHVRRIAGEPNRLTVRVRPHRVRHVRVQRLRHGAWTTVARGRTSAAGTYRVTRRTPAVSTSYRAVVTRLVTAKKRFTRATSRTRVRTQRQSVTLTMPATALRGTRIAAWIDASPVRKGRRVVLQRRSGAGWVTVEAGRENRRGRMVHRWSVLLRDTGTYRALVRRSHGARRVLSAQERLTVRRPPVTTPPVTTPPDTTAPDAPGGLEATPGDGSVALSWSAVGTPDLDGYRVYLSTGDGQWSPAPDQPGSLTALTVTGLSNGTAYQFAVTATDAADNESARSDPVTATPGPQP